MNVVYIFLEQRLNLTSLTTFENQNPFRVETRRE